MDQSESSPPTFQPTLSRALNHALDHIKNLDQSPVCATSTLTELRQRLARPLLNTGTNSAKVIDDLVADTRGGILGSAGGRFFGWVIGGTLPAALAADWLTATWNQNAALYACGPAAAVIEEVCGVWLKELLGIPSVASFAFVSGCQMAHVTCLAAARNAILQKRGWDVERDGLVGGPPIRVLVSADRHGSVDRAVRLLGLGTSSLKPVDVDDNGSMTTSSLREALAACGSNPSIVVLQAGNINTGVYDDFTPLIEIAHSFNAWVHIDGAFGLWAAASPTYRHVLAAAEMADSWATDGHKWLNVPYDCGYAFVAHPQAHLDSMSYRANYLTHDEEARDQIDWNADWSRRARGVPTYAALRQLGRDGVADLVERCCRHAEALVQQLGALPDVEVICMPIINQGMVRFLSKNEGATAEDHDHHTDTIIQALVDSGEAFFTGTTCRGRRCMRISVINWQTNERDVARAVDATIRILTQLRD